MPEGHPYVDRQETQEKKGEARLRVCCSVLVWWLEGHA